MNLYMNKELAKEKKLITDESTKRYDELETFYKYLFETYLLTKVNLNSYAEKIAKSELGFESPRLTKPVPNELRDFFMFNYIYNLNNYFIEKLSDEDLKLLGESYDSQKSSSPELTSLIERTFKDVIKNNYLTGKYSDEPTNIIYGMSIPSNAARNDAIVLKLYYSLQERYEDRDPFLKRLKESDEFINDIVSSIKKEIEENLNVNCDILVQMK